MVAGQRGPNTTGRLFVKASPGTVYQLISDPVAMVEFAEEVYRVRWLDGTAAARVGARFRGDNRKGLHRWWTIAKVTELVENKRLAYEVRTPFWVPISRWQYDIEPSGEGSVITESAWIRVPAWFIPFAIMITGSRHRAAVNAAHIATTLNALKRHLEAPAHV